MTTGRLVGILLMTAVVFYGALTLYRTTHHYHRPSPVNQCINTLRQIEGAKQQWALEKHMPTNAVPTIDELGEYLGRGDRKKTVAEVERIIQCPAGGKIKINAVCNPPTCSATNHFLETY